MVVCLHLSKSISMLTSFSLFDLYHIRSAQCIHIHQCINAYVHVYIGSTVMLIMSERLITRQSHTQPMHEKVPPCLNSLRLIGRPLCPHSSTYPFIHLFIFLSIYPFILLSFYPFILLSIYPLIYSLRQHFYTPENI